jgi:hypothetical protein
MTAALLHAAYRARVYRLAGWALDRWLVTLAWGGALLIGLYHWRDLRPFDAVLMALLVLVGAAVLWLRTWFARRAYVIFTPAAVDTPSPAPLDPADKVLLHATGVFEVEGRVQFFADLLAYWRTFGTREHAVMGILHASRLLGLAALPRRDLGMWYIFFRPERQRHVEAGSLTFGATVRPALRVVYEYPPVDADRTMGQRLRRQPADGRVATVYLAFDDAATQRLVWADLLSDG